ncbi:MAG: hypothetical protein ABJK39_15165 [Hyphomicrobiales bacterium]
MPINFRPLTPLDHQVAFDLVTEVFVNASTLHKALDITLEEYRPYLKASYDEMASSGLSVVAIDTKTNDVIGCLIGYDFHDHVHSKGTAPEKFAPLSALSNALCGSFIKDRKPKPLDIAYLDMAAIAPAYLGQGIYQNMRSFAHANAKKRGFKSVLGELSSAITQHFVLNKMGHTKQAEVWFEQFNYNGSKPFQSIKEPRSIILAEGQL